MPAKPPRILVLAASVGAGHLRAAQAVELALRQTRHDAVVRNIDILELTNGAFRKLYGQAYLDLVNKAPHVLGYFYDLMDQPSKSGKNRRDRFRLAVEKLNLRTFIRLLSDEPWDLVINTHFLPAEIIASLRTRGDLDVPQVTATTDFDTHRLWVNQPCDHYFTATAEGRNTSSTGACRRRTSLPSASPSTRSSPRRRNAGPVPKNTDWPAIGRLSFSWPAVSASARSSRFIGPFLVSRYRSKSS